MISFQILGANRHRVEQAKSHGAVAQSVMPGRPHQRKSVGAFLCRDRIENVQKTANRQQGDTEGVPASDGVAVQRISVHRRSRLDDANMIGAVNTFHIGATRAARRQLSKFLPVQAGRQIEQHLDALRPLRMGSPGKMFQVFLVDDNRGAFHKGKLTSNPGACKTPRKLANPHEIT